MKDEVRMEKGEMYHLDSSLYLDSLKFKTIGGRTVYGGGGITPDVFVPYDTTESSFYLTELIMSGVFQSFAFDFVSNKRNSWSGAKDFCERFVVNDNILQRFVAYAKNSYNVKENNIDFKRSKGYIINNLKAEIARQLYSEEGYYRVANTKDIELKRAMEQLRKMK